MIGGQTKERNPFLYVCTSIVHGVVYVWGGFLVFCGFGMWGFVGKKKNLKFCINNFINWEFLRRGKKITVAGWPGSGQGGCRGAHPLLPPFFQ